MEEINEQKVRKQPVRRVFINLTPFIPLSFKGEGSGYRLLNTYIYFCISGVK